MRIKSTIIIATAVLSLALSSAKAANYGDPKCEVWIKRLDGQEATINIIDQKFKVDRATNPYQKGYYAYVYRAKGMVFSVLVSNLEHKAVKIPGHENDRGEVVLSGSIYFGQVSTNQSTTDAFAAGKQLGLNLSNQKVSTALTCYSPGASID